SFKRLGTDIAYPEQIPAALLEVVPNSGKMTRRGRGPSTKYRHVLCRTSKSPQTREARSLEKKNAFPACEVNSMKLFLCSKLHRLKLLGPFYPPFEHALLIIFSSIHSQHDLIPEQSVCSWPISQPPTNRVLQK